MFPPLTALLQFLLTARINQAYYYNIEPFHITWVLALNYSKKRKKIKTLDNSRQLYIGITPRKTEIQLSFYKTPKLVKKNVSNGKLPLSEITEHLIRGLKGESLQRHLAIQQGPQSRSSTQKLNCKLETDRLQ